jgi:hypothetical protein
MTIREETRRAHRPPGRLLALLLFLLAGLPAAILSAPACAGADLLPALSAPAPVIAGNTVQWRPIALESSYEVAISNDARGSADRVTRYLSIARTPGETQSYTPVLSPGETAYLGISADGGVTWSAEEAVFTAPEPEPKPEPVPNTPPVLNLHGQTITWTSTPSATSYKLAISNDARGSADRVTRYLSIARTPGETQSYTPVLSPGETAYLGISADGGVTWSAEEIAVTAPKSEPEPAPEPAPKPKPEPEPAPEPKPEPKSEPVLNTPAPVLSLHGQTITWTSIPSATSYELATILNPTTTRETTYTTLTTTSITPPAVPGQTVNYGLAVNTLGTQGPWATEVTITYPATVPSPPAGNPPTGSEPTPPPPPPVHVEAPAPPPVASHKIIGTNDGSGWGSSVAQTILAGHITWDRVEIGSSSDTPAVSLSDGFHVLAIVGNVNDGTPLSQSEPASWGASVVSQLQANPGISIAEAGNEMYYKGQIANPVQYGRMYLAAVNAMKAAGIHTPLLFNMFGDYPLGSWSSPTGDSEDMHGGGWLHDAVAGVPGLGAAILANGLSSHPYGALGENDDDVNGVNAVGAQEAVAQTVLGAIPPIYITEFGYSLASCGTFIGACSQQEQATKMRAAYAVFLKDAHVAGIWWYQSHDDSTGQFGYMNSDNTIRPSFTTLSSIAIEQGQ